MPDEPRDGPIFSRHTAVVPDRERAGRWHADLPPIWGLPTLPQGGIVSAIAVRAMTAELATPEQRLRSVTTVFAAPVAVVTLCDTMPGAVAERMGSGGPSFTPPSTDLTVHLLADAGPGWLLAHTRARWAGDGYASAEIMVWDPTRGLVAYATQIMCFVFPDGRPSPAESRPRA